MSTVHGIVVLLLGICVLGGTGCGSSSGDDSGSGGGDGGTSDATTDSDRSDGDTRDSGNDARADGASADADADADADAAEDAETDASPSCTSGGGTGTLDVRFSAPPGPFATFDGPAGYLFDAAGGRAGEFRGDDTITLPAGAYVLELWRGMTAGDPVGVAVGVLDDTVREVCVRAGEETSLVIEYVQQPSSGRLWITSDNTLVSFSGAQVLTGGAVTPDVIEVALVNDFRAFAFDPMGNLWAATGPTFGSRLVWFAPSQLGPGSDGLISGSLSTSRFSADHAPISDIAFNEQGALLVAVHRIDDTFNGILEFSRAQLDRVLMSAADVSREPSAVIELSGVTGDTAMGFAVGALFVVDFEGNALLRLEDHRSVAHTFQFQYLDTGSLVPARGPRDLVSTSSAFRISFETSGFVASVNSAELYSTTPVLQVSLFSTFLIDQNPSGLAVADYVWAGNAGEVLRISAGSPPATHLESPALGDPVDLRFDPPRF